MGNVFQVSDWNGTSGEKWVANQNRLDAMLEIFGDAAIRAGAPKPGEYVLDIGCGAGASSLALARHVGAAGHVLGVDISDGLLALARRQADGIGHMRFDLADAGSAPLPIGQYDLLFSRFGVMFFDDPVAAFAHMRLALKPTGRLAFVCWREASGNDWVRLPMGVIRHILPPAPPPAPDAPGPFSFGDEKRVRRILEASGFTDIAIAPFDHAIPFGQGETREAAIDDALDMAFEVGPLSRALADQPEEIRRRAAEAVWEAFAKRPGERSVMIDGAAWIVTARNG